METETVVDLFWDWISGEGPRGLSPPTLSLDQTEARGAEKNVFETTPLSQGLDERNPPPPLTHPLI